jgi:hypothetical protein
MRFPRVLATSVIAFSLAGVVPLCLGLSLFDPSLRPDEVLVILARMNIGIPLASAALAIAVVRADVGCGMVLAALLRSGGREKTWFARLAAACLAAAGLGAIATACMAVTVTAVIGPVTATALMLTSLDVVIVALGWAAVGTGVGSLVASQLGGAVLIGVAAYMAEPLLLLVVSTGPEWLQPWSKMLPFSAGTDVVRGTAATAAAITESRAAWGADLVIFGGFALMTAMIGLAGFRRADLGPTRGV